MTDFNLASQSAKIPKLRQQVVVMQFDELTI